MDSPALIDIGLNLASSKFQNDWRAVLDRAHRANVSKVILTGTTLEGSERSAMLARKMAQGTAYFTAGVHPHYSSTLGAEGMSTIEQLMRDPLAVAVGETGLDYFRDLSPRSVQQDAFRRHVELACTLDKPLFLHERDAHHDFLRILESFGADLPPTVVHCFTGNAQQAQEYLQRGFYLGITGWVTQSKRNDGLLAAVPLIPEDKILFETDAPYLKPATYTCPIPGRNEPEALPLVAQRVAEIRNVPLPELTASVFRNTTRFFRLE